MESRKNVPTPTSTKILLVPRPSGSGTGPGGSSKTPMTIQLPGVTEGKPILIKSTSGNKLMAYPVQRPAAPAAPAATSTPSAPLANIKPKLEPAPTPMASALPFALQGNFVPQIVQSGNQRLLLTNTPTGPQLIPITTIEQKPRFATLAPNSLPLQSPAASASSSGSAPSTSFAFQGGAGTGYGSGSYMTAPLAPQLNFMSQTTPLATSSILSRKRSFPSDDISFETKRCRRPEKANKGLRHFSLKVCEKVRAKGTTTYNEVADELVNEFAPRHSGLVTPTEIQFDQKNIRRRVYDALNVLMAMNIISKEKKEIKWIGLPTNSAQESIQLQAQRDEQIERIKKKTEILHDLIVQQVAFRNLVERNKEREKVEGPPPPCGSIHLPFLIASTSNKTVIDCSISQDKMEYLFNFNDTFEIHDDIEVLKRMGLALGLDKNECTDENIAKAKGLLPKDLADYVDVIAKRTNDWESEFDILGSDPAHFNDDDPITPHADADDNQGHGEDGDYKDESMFESFGAGGTMTLNGDSDTNGFPVDFEIQAAIDALSTTKLKSNNTTTQLNGEDEDDEFEDD